jgi:hypothetical protein
LFNQESVMLHISYKFLHIELDNHLNFDLQLFMRKKDATGVLYPFHVICITGS